MVLETRTVGKTGSGPDRQQQSHLDPSLPCVDVLQRILSWETREQIGFKLNIVLD